MSNIAYNAYLLSNKNIELENAIRAKSDFLANMSHEIRTPMNAVLGMAEMALREEMSFSARDYLHQIRASGKNLLVIINDILDFSKIESGKMDIVPVTYETMSLFNDVASIVSSRIGKKEIEFTMDIDPTIPHVLMGDSVRFQQVLINILNNAVKFTKQGNIHLKAESIPAEDGTVIIRTSVTDTGSGIRKEDMGKLFKSFQQVDSKRNRNIEGTGLGLAITRQLLELMNGTISVESEYEKGTTFTMELPQKVVTEAPSIPKDEINFNIAVLIENQYVKKQIYKDLAYINADCIDISEETASKNKKYDFFIVDQKFFNDKMKEYFIAHKNIRCIVVDGFDNTDKIKAPEIKVIRRPVYFLNLYAALGIINDYVRDDMLSSEDFSFTAPDAHVLIVDDNTVNLTVAKGLIEPLKMQVDTACSADETIEIIKKVKYDLIFMDHMMPEVDGVETTHIIRRLIAGYENVPIIALTANAIEGTREMFIREGMNDFVAKPIDVKEITAKIKKWLPKEKIVPLDGSAESDPSEKSTLKIEGLNIEYALRLLGSEKLFLSILKEYYFAIDQKYFTIKSLFQNENWKDYTIEVHALKSISRQIGAEQLSDLAKELEAAGKRNDIDFIRENTERMLSIYLSHKQLLKPYFPDAKTEKPLKEADPREMIKLLEELNNALENYDTLMIDEVIEKMSEYKFEDVFLEYYQQLKLSATESDIDACREEAAQWKKEIVDLYLESR